MGQRQNLTSARHDIGSQVYKIYLVQEYCEGGNLTEALNNKLFWDHQNKRPMLVNISINIHNNS